MFLVQITRIFSFIKKNLWKVRNSKRVAAINSNTKDGGGKNSSFCLACPSSRFHGFCLLHLTWFSIIRTAADTMVLSRRWYRRQPQYHPGGICGACLCAYVMVMEKQGRLTGVLRELSLDVVDTTRRQSWSFS